MVQGERDVREGGLKSYGGVCHSRLAKLHNGDGGQRSYISAGMASGTIRAASIYLRRAKTFGPPPPPPLRPYIYIYRVHIKRREKSERGWLPEMYDGVRGGLTM